MTLVLILLIAAVIVQIISLVPGSRVPQGWGFLLFLLACVFARVPIN